MKNLDSSILLQALVTFGAVILGFMLSHVSEGRKDRLRERQKQASLNRLLKLETEENVLALRNHWDRVLESSDSWVDKENRFKFGLMAKTIAENPYPIISTAVWYANISELPSYVDYPRLEKLWTFYQRVERLQVIHNFLSDADTDRRNAIEYGRLQEDVVTAQLLAGSDFAERVRAHSEKYKLLIEKILDFHINA
ncbi:MAG: hypothetical protein CMQ46_02965 [Gammaproteobacteria bacterium]|nr:hypothetical protein [Gammaproteobacteria bacterium]MBJ54207.1 hypothetical protein [Gammaproteobacteria bacterium]